MGLTHTSVVDAPLGEVFAWHGRRGAIVRLMPPWTPMRVERESGSLRDGQAVSYSTAPSSADANVFWHAGSVLALGPGWSGLDLTELPGTVDAVDDLPATLRHIATRLGSPLGAPLDRQPARR